MKNSEATTYSVATLTDTLLEIAQELEMLQRRQAEADDARSVFEYTIRKYHSDHTNRGEYALTGTARKYACAAKELDDLRRRIMAKAATLPDYARRRIEEDLTIHDYYNRKHDCEEIRESYQALMGLSARQQDICDWLLDGLVLTYTTAEGVKAAKARAYREWDRLYTELGKR